MLSPHEHQDIARSSYADMLNDDERNRNYEIAIRCSVTKLVTSKEHNPSGDRFFKCCDIGTGSGLLSMMIVRTFQELGYDKFHVTAFEAFKYMANCAKRVIDTNSMSNFISVIPKRSDQIGAENPQFDLLVAELLDTELIGEGCLAVYRHAIENLCSPNCLFIPHKARIYVEPVASTFLFQRHAIDDIRLNLGENKNVFVKVPEESKNCCGMPEIDDMQASMLHEGKDFTRISEPKVVFEFTFNKIEQLKLNDHVQIEFPIKKKIEQPPVIVMWWDIIMYDQDFVADEHINKPTFVSCAPVWARDDNMLKQDQAIRELYGRDVWREHWIQGIYYFASVKETRQLVGLNEGSKLTIHAYHDSHSLWFDLNICETKLPATCRCGVHRLLSRSQLASLGNTDQMRKLLAALLHDNEIHHLDVQGKIQFQHQRSNVHAESEIERVFSDKDCNTHNWQIIIDKYVSQKQLVLYDPSINDEIPWQKSLVRSYKGLSIRPVSDYVIKCTQVRFQNLHRIRAEIKECERFNLQALDEMISKSAELDSLLEPHYLWEYDCIRTDIDHVVLSCFNDGTHHTIAPHPGEWSHLKLPIVEHSFKDWKKSWALVFWAEFKLQHTGETISSGLINECAIGEKIEWNRYCEQHVYFMDKFPTAASTHIDLTVGLTEDLCLIVHR